jgi:hypothetical protein
MSTRRRATATRRIQPLNPNLAQVDLTQDQELVELVKESLRLRLAKEAARRAKTSPPATPRSPVLDLAGIKPFDSQEQADEALLLQPPPTPAALAASKLLLEDLLQRPERLSSPDAADDQRLAELVARLGKRKAIEKGGARYLKKGPVRRRR